MSVSYHSSKDVGNGFYVLTHRERPNYAAYLSFVGLERMGRGIAL